MGRRRARIGTAISPASSGTTRSATRSRAEAARGLASTSAADGRRGARTRRTVCTAPHTHGRPGGHVAGAGGPTEAILDDAVLAGVVRQHRDPATRNRGLDGGVDRRRQHVQLAVDLDPDGLERALGRVPAGAAGGRRDGRRDDGRQLRRSTRSGRAATIALAIRLANRSSPYSRGAPASARRRRSR